MVAPASRLDNRMTLMSTLTDTHDLSEEILALLDAPAGGDGAPSLRALEDTLTSGYARALALEAQRERLERALTAASGPEESNVHRQLEQTKNDLAELRRLLVPLRSRARAIRALGL